MLDNYTKNPTGLQLEPQKSRKEHTQLFDDEQALKLFNQRYIKTEKGWKDTLNSRKDKTHKYLTDISILNNKSKEKFDRRASAYQDLYQNTRFTYILETPCIKDIHDFYSHQKCKKVVTLLSKTIVSKFFWKFELNLQMKPHIHICSRQQTQTVIDKLGLKNQEIELYSETYFSYLLKPDYFVRKEDYNTHTSENQKIRIGYHLFYRNKFKNKKSPSRHGVSDGIKE
jgi:hypothetical protein